MFIRVTPTFYDHVTKTTQVVKFKQLIHVDQIYEINPTEDGKSHLVMNGRTMIVNEPYRDVSGWLEEKGLVLG